MDLTTHNPVSRDSARQADTQVIEAVVAILDRSCNDGFWSPERTRALAIEILEAAFERPEFSQGHDQ
jgi:hypothetical protein